MPSTPCFFDTRFVQNPFFLLAGALLYDEKKNPPKCCINMEQLLTFPTFLETGLVEKIAVSCTYYQSTGEVGGLEVYL